MKRKFTKFILSLLGVSLLSFCIALFTYLPQSEHSLAETFSYVFFTCSLIYVIGAWCRKMFSHEDIYIGDWVEVTGKPSHAGSWRVTDYNPHTKNFVLKNPIEGGRIFVKKNRLLVLPKIEDGSWVRIGSDGEGRPEAFGQVENFDGFSMDVIVHNQFRFKESLASVRPASFTEIFDNQLGL